MGRTPEEYCDYWTTRFPKLLMHSWYSMHCVKNEHIFSRYYDKQYDFIQVSFHYKDYICLNDFNLHCIIHSIEVYRLANSKTENRFPSGFGNGIPRTRSVVSQKTD